MEMVFILIFLISIHLCTSFGPGSGWKRLAMGLQRSIGDSRFATSSPRLTDVDAKSADFFSRIIYSNQVRGNEPVMCRIVASASELQALRTRFAIPFDIAYLGANVTLSRSPEDSRGICVEGDMEAQFFVNCDSQVKVESSSIEGKDKSAAVAPVVSSTAHFVTVVFDRTASARTAPTSTNSKPSLPSSSHTSSSASSSSTSSFSQGGAFDVDHTGDWSDNPLFDDATNERGAVDLGDILSQYFSMHFLQ